MLFKKRDQDTWGFVPPSKDIDKLCTVYPGSCPGRVSHSEIYRQMEADNFRSLGAENSSRRVTSKIHRQTSKVRGTDNKFNQLCTYVKFIRRGRKIIKKRCYRISTVRSGRPRVLQHFFRCPKKGRRSPSNIEFKTTQSLHGKFSFQDGNTTVHYSSPQYGRLGVHLRSTGCISSDSYVSTSQKISEVKLLMKGVVSF